MRIRAIKPIFWRDRELARVGDEVRLFYIGLWMQADDAGFFRWNPDEIGADLYPFLSEKSRLRKISKCVDSLATMEGQERLSILPCGHAFLTRFIDHQKPGGGSRITTFATQHQRCPRQIPTSPDISGVVGRDNTGLRTGQYKTVPASGSIDPVEGAVAFSAPLSVRRRAAAHRGAN